MSKTDGMVLYRQQESNRKKQIALDAIDTMERNGEKVTIAKLVSATGLSRSFFNQNETISERLNHIKNKYQRTNCTIKSDEYKDLVDRYNKLCNGELYRIYKEL